MDFAKRITKKLTGNNEKQNSGFQGKNMDQSAIYGGSAPKGHFKPPLNTMNRTY